MDSVEQYPGEEPLGTEYFDTTTGTKWRKIAPNKWVKIPPSEESSVNRGLLIPRRD